MTATPQAATAMSIDERINEHARRNCLFCKILKDEEPIKYRKLRLEDLDKKLENSGKKFHEVALAILDKEPKILGHTLVISKIPFDDVTDSVCRNMQEDERIDVFRVAVDLAERMKRILNAEKIYVMSMCEHWNIWETEDGQTTEHLHFHLVPRYPGMRTKHEAGENLLARKGSPKDKESLSNIAKNINRMLLTEVRG